MARQVGTLVKWDDDRGFGFIAVPGQRDQVFVHIRSIGAIATRPRIGDEVSFELGQGADGRSRAEQVMIAGANPLSREALRRGLPQQPVAPLSLRVLGAVGLFWLVIAAVFLGGAPIWLLWAYLGMGFVTARLYWMDKQSAATGQWRTAEATLHGFDLAGGIVGGLLAQHMFRHKTIKPGYVAATAIIFVIHVAFNAACG